MGVANCYSNACMHAEHFVEIDKALREIDLTSLSFVSKVVETPAFAIGLHIDEWEPRLGENDYVKLAIRIKQLNGVPSPLLSGTIIALTRLDSSTESEGTIREDGSACLQVYNLDPKFRLCLVLR